MRRLALPLAVAGILAAVPAASADVLVSAIPKRLSCGAAITPGIWAQPGTTGDRTVRMRVIDRGSGRVWWRKTARARTRGGWRFWTLPSGMGGRCGPTTVVYALGGRTVKYRVRFRDEGA